MPTLESHPLTPFLPPNAQILLLGSFPPQQKRWSMDFFYPNFQNDMWRILGMIFFADKNFFVESTEKRFRKEEVIQFAEDTGIAFYDTAEVVRRLKDNASDNHLEIVRPTDIGQLLPKLPLCTAIATTGEKATNELTSQYHTPKPKIGESIPIQIGTRHISLYRMPSTSRAYPLSIEKKAAYYHRMFRDLNML